MSSISHWYYPVRHDGKGLGVHQTRHAAVGQIARARANKRGWYDIQLINPLAFLDWTPRQTPDFGPHKGVWGQEDTDE